MERSFDWSEILTHVEMLVDLQRANFIDSRIVFHIFYSGLAVEECCFTQRADESDGNSIFNILGEQEEEVYSDQSRWGRSNCLDSASVLSVPDSRRPSQ